MNAKKTHIRSGEVFIDTLMDENERLYHLILLPGDAEAANRETQLKWAKSLGGDLPTRLELRVLFDQAGSYFKPEPYWSCEPDQRKITWSWYQHFGTGYQDTNYKRNELRARAVRREFI